MSQKRQIHSTEHSLLAAEIRKVHQRINKIRNNQNPTIPRYVLGSEPQDPVEGQIAIIPDSTTVVVGTGVLPRNVSELGFSGDTGLSSTYTHTVQFQALPAHDGILVSAQAPSKSSGGATAGHPISCTDSRGNTYSILHSRAFEAASPVANEGIYVVLFYCADATAPLVQGLDTITVTWDNPVYDRSIYAWQTHNDEGPPTLTVLDSTTSNDAGVYASSQVTLTAPDYTPALSNALELAIIYSAKTGGFSFGGVGGYVGFFQAQARIFNGSQQNYLMNVQTYGSDIYLKVGSSIAQYEIDQGLLPLGVLVPSFNGVGQGYSTSNNWKGIILLGVG